MQLNKILLLPLLSKVILSDFFNIAAFYITFFALKYSFNYFCIMISIAFTIFSSTCVNLSRLSPFLLFLNSSFQYYITFYSLLCALFITLLLPFYCMFSSTLLQIILRASCAHSYLLLKIFIAYSYFLSYCICNHIILTTL